jgi:hypothetical protein
VNLSEICQHPPVADLKCIRDGSIICQHIDLRSA